MRSRPLTCYAITRLYSCDNPFVAIIRLIIAYCYSIGITSLESLRSLPVAIEYQVNYLLPPAPRRGGMTAEANESPSSLLLSPTHIFIFFHHFHLFSVRLGFTSYVFCHDLALKSLTLKTLPKIYLELPIGILFFWAFFRSRSLAGYFFAKIWHFRVSEYFLLLCP